MKKNTTHNTTAESQVTAPESRLTRLPDDELVRVQGGGWRFQQVPPEDPNTARVGAIGT